MNAANLTLTPLDKRLLGWLDTNPARFERYITAHPDAGDRVDQILSLGEDMQRALANVRDSVLAAPLDLMDKLSAAISGAGDTGSTSVAMDLLGIGGETLTTWLGP